jgi:hypothetical protein
MASETMVLERQSVTVSATARQAHTPRRPRYKGLCSTCTHARHCTYPRDPQRTVIHCDEFEGVQAVSAKLTLCKMQPARGGAVPEAVEYRGLCRNCDNRATCTYPRPEWGVWQCEEYQ